jgi:hypothetical protein
VKIAAALGIRKGLASHGGNSRFAAQCIGLVGSLQDWLNEFERVQWLLFLSPRLRQLHRD